MKSDAEIIDESIPEQAFFSPKELGSIGPFSSDYWQRRIADGSVRAVQHTRGTQGSRTYVPRAEVRRHLREKLR